MKHRILALFVAASAWLALAAASQTFAQEAGPAPPAPAPAPAPTSPRELPIRVGAFLGLSAGTPDGAVFAVGGYGDFFLTQHISLGPLAQVCIDDDFNQLAASIQAKYTFSVPEIEKLRPSAEIGLGLVIAERSHPRHNVGGSLLLPLGGGVAYMITDSIAIETRVYFNFDDVFNDDFFFTWFLGASFNF
jgi:hypothetical protein